jgi:hypothetical protein
MNSIKNSLLFTSAAVTVGVVAFSFADAAFTASLPFEIVMSIGASLGLLGIAVADYGRANRSLVPLASLLRPVWIISPAKSTPASAGKDNNTDRLAA